jgi:crossover junction endodeoxyribonuclease RusA
VIVLPWPPSVNGYWRSFRGRQIISREGRVYRETAVALVRAGQHLAIGRAPCNVSIVAWMPDARRRDVDNLLKAPLDALAHAGLYDDDSQIQMLTVRKAAIDRANPRIEITVVAA